jgi:hypothetical protein
MALTRIPSSGIEGNITLGNVVISGTITDSNGAPFLTDGAAGYTGSKGADGTIGVDGYTGSTGINGYTGSIGDIGYTGSASTEVGYTGSAGFGYTGSAGLLAWTLISATHTAQDRQRLILNSSGGSFDVTLPATPTVGTYVQFTEGANLNTYPVTVLRNGSTIENISNDLILDVPNATFEFIYDGSTWQVTSTVGPKGDTGYTGSSGLLFDGNIAGNLTVGGTTFVTGNIIPTSNNTVNIGSPTARFGTIYISANTIDIGGSTLSTNETGDLAFTSQSGQIDFNSNIVSFLSNVAIEGPPSVGGGGGGGATSLPILTRTQLLNVATSSGSVLVILTRSGSVSLNFT